MDPGEEPSRLPLLIEGMRRLRRASLAAVAAYIIALAGSFLLFIPLSNAALQVIIGSAQEEVLEDLASTLREDLLVALAVTVASDAILVYALYHLWIASSALSRLRDELGVGALGALLGMIAITLALPGSVLAAGALWRAAVEGSIEAAKGLFFKGISLLFLGGLLHVASAALISLMLIRMENLSGEDGLPLMGSWKSLGSILAAGIGFKLLFRGMMGVVGSLLIVIVYALTYIYADETLKAIEWSGEGRGL